MTRHENTVAVITGGTQGLGLAIARRLAAEGARGIVICGRHPGKGEQAAAEVRTMGAACRYVQADMAVPEDCYRVVDTAVETFGRINALVNSAAISTRGGLLDTDLALWEQHMAINLRAPFLTMQRAVKYMKEAKEPGSIVNIISMVALCGQSYLTPYSASKGGLATLTKNVANAFARDRIRCNGVLVGWMETPGEAEIQRRFHGAGDDWTVQAARKLPMGQLVQPDQVAGLVSYMLSPESGVMTGSLVEYDQFVSGAYPE
ncbi:MAG: SDR family oxidoreductase [Caldilineales bacterium]|nr:SDR family oxidoreductase [Caldilineales bacterium]MDW8316727.1 SDR family oxidoreductase [Anaerolineae bacterium]